MSKKNKIVEALKSLGTPAQKDPNSITLDELLPPIPEGHATGIDATAAANGLPITEETSELKVGDTVVLENDPAKLLMTVNAIDAEKQTAVCIFTAYDQTKAEHYPIDKLIKVVVEEDESGDETGIDTGIKEPKEPIDVIGDSEGATPLERLVSACLLKDIKLKIERCEDKEGGKHYNLTASYETDETTRSHSGRIEENATHGECADFYAAAVAALAVPE